MASLALAVALIGAAAQPEGFLGSHPDLRVLRIEDSVRSEDRLRYIQAGYFRPRLASDLTGDGIVDLVLAVVQEQGDTKLFGVVVFLGTGAGFLQEHLWAVPLDKYPLQGVHVEGQNRLVPQYCTECDSNPFTRWNGEAFELNLYEAGDETCAADFHEPVVVHERPQAGAPAVGQVRGEAPATVLEVGSRDGSGERWFRVKVELSPHTSFEGWLRGSKLCGGCCIG